MYQTQAPPRIRRYRSALALAVLLTACHAPVSPSGPSDGGVDATSFDGSAQVADVLGRGSPAPDQEDGAVSTWAPKPQEVPDGGTFETADPTDTCAAREEAIQAHIDGTYAVVLEARLQDEATGQVFLGYFTLGTAFAVGNHLLATNAHVMDEELLASLGLSRVLAVQAGTGSVVEMATAFVHPDFTGNPVVSPDLALAATLKAMPSPLPVASWSDLEALLPGEPILVTGFPGDVDLLFPVTPEVNVPQATVLTGYISALRNYTQSALTTTNVDIIQHQAPTTPGSSGSAVLHCGQVIGVNNAGTFKPVVGVDSEGELFVDRVAPGANNFAVHGRHLKDLMSRYYAGELTGFALPPKPVIANTEGAGFDNP